MKLRNKKTGEIVMVCKINPEPYEAREFECSSLAELNEEWEDYKNLKEYWYIDYNGSVKCFQYLDYDWQEEMQAIGNFFETKEDAEKAVEKLKAFKRLKDLGFRFEGIRFRNNHSYIEWKVEPKNELTDDEAGELLENLYKVFGGKE